MTMIQAVFAATAAAVVAAIALIVIGVALLFGAAWACIVAGALLAIASVGGSVVLLRDGSSA